METKGRPPARAPIFEPPSDEECGPAMRALTPQAKAFVVELVIHGAAKGAQTRAAMTAGIGGTEDSAAVWASRAMRNPKILAAIREEADKRCQAGALLGASVLMEIAEDTMHKDRFKAATELMNRAGLIVATVQKIQHELIDSRTTKDLAASIDERMKKLGLLKDDGQQIIEAEFEVVGSSEGLEDLLA